MLLFDVSKPLICVLRRFRAQAVDDVGAHRILPNAVRDGADGRGRKPAREHIEAMLERDYQMQKTGDSDYTLINVYDREPDRVSPDDEIENPQTEMFNIAESFIEVDINDISG